MVDQNKHSGNAEQLKKYWTTGAGAAKINWGVDGDFDRCLAEVGKFMPDAEAKGYCFTGETRFLTHNGPMRFDEAAGTSQLVLTAPKPSGVAAVNHNGHWVEADIESFGEQPVLSVTVQRGKRAPKVIRATPEHTWFMTRTSRNNQLLVRAKQTSELQAGDATLASLLPSQHLARSTPSPFGIAAGFIFGDGCASTNGCRVILWGEKDAELAHYFDGCGSFIEKTNENGTRGLAINTGIPRSWKSLPALDEGPSYVYGWLAGYFAADGCVGSNGHAALASASRENLEFATIVALRLGITTLGISSSMRIGKGTEPTPMYKLSFASETVPSALFILSEHRRKFDEINRMTSSVRWRVIGIEDHGEVEQVYCAVVPELETFALEDNIWVHNCANLHKRATGSWPGHAPGESKPGTGHAETLARQITGDKT